MENNKDIIVNFYQENRSLIDIIGFVGVVCALFLQISQFQSEALKMVQAILLLFFILLLTYLLFKILIKLDQDKNNTSLNAQIKALASVIIVTFEIYLFKFLYESFYNELSDLLLGLRLGILLVVYYYFENIISFFTSKFGNKNLWIVINEFLYTALFYLLFIFPNYHFKSIWLLFCFLLFVTGSFGRTKLIRSEAFYFLLSIILLGIILSLYPQIIISVFRLNN